MLNGKSSAETGLQGLHAPIKSDDGSESFVVNKLLAGVFNTAVVFICRAFLCLDLDL